MQYFELVIIKLFLSLQDGGQSPQCLAEDAAHAQYHMLNTSMYWAATTDQIS